MKISVLTASFNSGAYLERAIKSVLCQNYENFEHIIIDGGSTDETNEIVKRYDHLNYISEPDEGQADAMNKAFRKATGEIIVYLNADDYFESNVFEDVARQFKNRNCNILVGGLYYRYKGTTAERLLYPEIEFSKIIYPKRYTFPFNPVCYFYRKEVQQKIGEFPINEHYAMDYWFLLRAIDMFPATKIQLPLGTFFWSGENKTAIDGGRSAETIARQYMQTKGTGRFFTYLAKGYIHEVFFIFSHRKWTWPMKYLIYLMKKKYKTMTFLEYRTKPFSWKNSL
jgi:glycosyltransferase involved in cell wall biosynthesis